MIEEEGPRPRYKWRLTWPDEMKNHFIGFDGIYRVGMIHERHLGYWLWFLHLGEGTNGPALHPTSGTGDTARLAAKAVEDCYDRQLEGTWPGMPEDIRQRAMALANRSGRQYSQ